MRAAGNRYFTTHDDRCFVPIGLNLCFPRFITGGKDGLAVYERWFDRLVENGCNFTRLWLGHPFFDVEPQRAGEFSEDQARRLDRVLAMAHARNIQVKLTLEHFRSLVPRSEVETFPGVASFCKPAYSRSRGGCADTMDEFFNLPESRRMFMRKLDWLAARYAGHPAIFGWELWNEADTVDHPGWYEWTLAMLPELRRRFPRHRVMQSLRSFGSDEARIDYELYAKIADADLVQVHRYIDHGAPYSICHGPMDTLCADAIRELRRLAPGKPVVMAETGAVEPRHTAPSKVYSKDTTGVLLHDMLFAPFFSGSAGSGQPWHWDFYVDKNNLWWHFGRFARAIQDFDPIKETAEPLQWDTPEFRVYALRGGSTSLLWLRDRRSDWRTELVEDRPASVIEGAELVLPDGLRPTGPITAYHPWTDVSESIGEQAADRITLPTVCRSVVLRLTI